MGLTWTKLRGDLINAAISNRTPLLGEFELTARCNLQCKMCYVCRPVNDKDALIRERSAKEWIQLAKEARDAGMLYLLLTGGEVFIRQDFKEIYEEVTKMGLIISVNTNATMITPEIAKWMGRIPPSIVSVTLYGASGETYEKVCGDASGYDRALRGIELLMSEGINIQIRITIIRGNVNDFTRLKEFAKKCGTSIGIVNYISPRREGYNTYPEAERLSPDELMKFLMNIKYLSNRKADDTNRNDQDKMNINTVKKEEEHPFQCTSGKCNFWITWDGRMIPCAIMDEPSLKIFEKSFYDGWKEFQEICTKVPICLECKVCLYKEKCMSCPARLKNETGYCDKPASYLCELAKKRIDFQLEKDEHVLSIN